jgi:hypothetical protein
MCCRKSPAGEIIEITPSLSTASLPHQLTPILPTSSSAPSNPPCRRNKDRWTGCLSVSMLLSPLSHSPKVLAANQRSSILQQGFVTCFRFFGQWNLLFWTAQREPSDVESAV